MINVQKLNGEDAEALHSLLSRVFGEIEGHSYPAELIAPQREAYSLKNIKERVADPNSVLLGAFEEGALLGFAIGRDSEDGVFLLQWIGVEPAARRKGVMRKLMEALESELVLRQSFKIFLMASVKDKAAIERFLSMGYRIEGVHPNHSYGWDFISFGKPIVVKKWEDPAAAEPDFDIGSLIRFYANG